MSKALAQKDREARRAWKAAFFEAYHAIGTRYQTEAVKKLGVVSTVYLTINREAEAAGVAYDPRKAKTK